MPSNEASNSQESPIGVNIGSLRAAQEAIAASNPWDATDLYERFRRAQMEMPVWSDQSRVYNLSHRFDSESQRDIANRICNMIADIDDRGLLIEEITNYLDN